MANLLICQGLTLDNTASVVGKLLQWLAAFSDGPNYVDGIGITIFPPDKDGLSGLCFRWEYLRQRSNGNPEVWNALPSSLAVLNIPWTRIVVGSNEAYNCVDGRIPTLDEIQGMREKRAQEAKQQTSVIREGKQWADHLAPPWDGW